MRKYNHKISEKANETLNKRAKVVRTQWCIFAIIIFLIILLGIFFGTSMNTLANPKDSSYKKYYKSIRIKSGDTLWTIADKYTADTNINKSDYIREICQLNNINADDIHAGNYIIITYYSSDRLSITDAQ